MSLKQTFFTLAAGGFATLMPFMMKAQGDAVASTDNKVTSEAVSTYNAAATNDEATYDPTPGGGDKPYIKYGGVNEAGITQS